MIDKLTRWEPIQYNPEGNLEISDTGDWLDFEEVKELLVEQEKKTKNLVKVLTEVSKDNCSCDKSIYNVYPKDNILYTQESPCCTRLPEQEDSIYSLVLSPLGSYNAFGECWQQHYWFTVFSYYKERSDIKWAHCKNTQIGSFEKKCIVCKAKEALEEYKKENQNDNKLTWQQERYAALAEVERLKEEVELLNQKLEVIDLWSSIPTEAHTWQQERAAAVAWLRAPLVGQSVFNAIDLCAAANRIELGEHWPEGGTL